MLRSIKRIKIAKDVLYYTNYHLQEIIFQNTQKMIMQNDISCKLARCGYFVLLKFHSLRLYSFQSVVRPPALQFLTLLKTKNIKLKTYWDQNLQKVEFLVTLVIT